jgi:hypothetical protein
VIAVEKLSEVFRSSFDNLLNTSAFFRSNPVNILQALILFLLPQISAYLVEYNKEFGITARLDNYPLLIVLLLFAALYIVVEPSLLRKQGRNVLQIALLSALIFTIGLAVNLMYKSFIVLFDIDDPWEREINNAVVGLNISDERFAQIYIIPFLFVSVTIVLVNSAKRWGGRRTRYWRSALFWRSFIVVVILAAFQYIAFVLNGKTVADT